MPRLGDSVVFMKAVEIWVCAEVMSTIFPLSLFRSFKSPSGWATNMDNYLQDCVGSRIDGVWYLGGGMEHTDHVLLAAEDRKADNYRMTAVIDRWYPTQYLTPCGHDRDQRFELWDKLGRFIIDNGSGIFLIHTKRGQTPCQD